MYNTTTALAAALATKRLNLKVVCGSSTLEGNRIASCTYAASIGGTDSLTIGGVTAAMVTLQVNQRVAWRDQSITVSIGAEVNGEIEYVPLGTFAVTDCKQAEDITTITAYDAGYYALGGTYVPAVSSGATVAAVLADVADQCELTLATLPAAASTTTVTGDLTGHTCREMVGYLAALVGCNALINRDGKLVLRWFSASGQSFGPGDYYSAGLSLDGVAVLNGIRAEAETSTTDADGNTSAVIHTYTVGDTGVGVTIQNPYMTQEILNAVWASIGGLTCAVGSCSIFHGLLVEPGDLVTITDKTDTAHTLAVMSLTMTIDGGCKTTLYATGESATDTTAAMQGSLGGKVNQLVVDLAKVKQLMIEDANGVTKINGGRIDTDSLFAQNITATGTVTGLKLRGDCIDIAATYTENDVTYTNRLCSGVDDVGSAELVLQQGIEQTDGTELYSGIYISDGGMSVEAADYITVRSDTDDMLTKDFSDSHISSGTVLESRKMGWCALSAIMTLSAAVGNSWVTVMDTLPPQHGKNVYTTVPAVNSTSVKPLSARVTPSGELQLRYGGAGTYYFELVFPQDVL